MPASGKRHCGPIGFRGDLGAYHRDLNKAKRSAMFDKEEIEDLALHMARLAVKTIDEPEGTGYGAARLARKFYRMLKRRL